MEVKGIFVISSFCRNKNWQFILAENELCVYQPWLNALFKKNLDIHLIIIYMYSFKILAVLPSCGVDGSLKHNRTENVNANPKTASD